MDIECKKDGTLIQGYLRVFESSDYFLKYFYLKIHQNNFFIFKKLFLTLAHQNNMKIKKINLK
jgi:hypothetical protein